MTSVDRMLSITLLVGKGREALGGGGRGWEVISVL